MTSATFATVSVRHMVELIGKMTEYLELWEIVRRDIAMKDINRLLEIGAMKPWQRQWQWGLIPVKQPWTTDDMIESWIRIPTGKFRPDSSNRNRLCISYKVSQCLELTPEQDEATTYIRGWRSDDTRFYPVVGRLYLAFKDITAESISELKLDAEDLRVFLGVSSGIDLALAEMRKLAEAAEYKEMELLPAMVEWAEAQRTSEIPE